MKQTRTALKELTAMYRAVLRHGILCNAIALGLIATATPAMAEREPAADRLVVAGGQSVESENFSWSGFSGSQYGGAVDNSGNLTLTGVEFANNSAVSLGGAIDNYNGDVTINGNSIFSGNSAASGGAVDTDGGKLTINSGVSFNSNSATNGGAIVMSNGAVVNITGASFASNEATSSGGGLLDNGAVVNIKGVIGTDTFKQNSAQNGGGIFVTTKGNTSVEDATFKSNTATDNAGAVYNKGILKVTNSNFDGNKSNSLAGAIYNIGTLSVIGSTFDGNNSAQGGAIIDNTEATGGMTITNSTFKNNTATVGDGAIGIFSGHGTTINNVQFKSNSAGEAGAVFVGAEATANIINGSVFDSNTATTVGGAIATRSVDAGTNSKAKLDIVGATFKGNSAGTTGGAIDNNFYNSVGHAGSVYVSGTTFGGTGTGEGNSAANGGAIYNHKNATQTGNMYITDSTFTGNTATANGGAVYNEGTVTLDDSTFTGNSATTSGGAVYNAGELTINGGAFTNSSSKNGGAIFNSTTGDINIKNGTTFTSNSATYGGAINNVNGKLGIDGAIFTGNVSSSYGGAVRIAGASDDIEISGSEFTGNYANGSQGGAIYNYAATGKTLTLNNNTFSGNGKLVDSNNVTVKTTKGGALYNANAGTMKIVGGSITKNAAKDGGAIYVASGSLSINGTSITDNMSAKGGALSSASVFNITNATIDGNVALNEKAASYFIEGPNSQGNYYSVANGVATAGQGGAIYNSVSGKTSSITGGSMSSNVAYEGGAIYNAKGTIEIDGTTFTGNTALSRGGALVNLNLTTNSAVTSIKDTTFTGNAAAGLGGAIYNSLQTLILDGSNTFSDNKSNVVWDENNNIMEYVANDIYNNGGIINIISAAGETNTFAGGIDGNGAAAKFYINGAGTVNVSNALTGNTVAVNAGELHLTKADLTGSTINVASGAIINTIDDAIQDLSSNITLADGAGIKGDIDWNSGTADKYASAAGTVKYYVGNLLNGNIGKGEKAFQVVSDGTTVDIAEAIFTSDTGATFKSSGAADGQMIVRGFAGGINTAVETTDANGARLALNYTVTENEVFDSDDSIDNSDFRITGTGADGLAIELQKDLNVSENAKLSLNDVKFTGSSDIVNKAGATLNIKDSFIGVNVNNFGVLKSDPTTYAGTVNNAAGATAEFDNDTFGATATLANAGTVDLKNSVTFASGASITGAGVMNLVSGTTAFNDTANTNNVFVANGAKFSGSLIGGALNTQNGAIDSGLGTIKNADLYVDASLTGTGSIDSFAGATGSTIKSINLTASEYGTADSISLNVGDATVASDVQISGAMNYYTKVAQNGTNLVFSDKLLNESTLYSKLGTWSGGKHIKSNVDLEHAADASHLTVGSALSALDTAIGDMSGFGSQNYATNTGSVAANITALDTQLKTVSTEGTIASGNTGFVSGGAVYTALADKVDTTRTINGHALNADVTLGASDVLTTDQLAAANSGITATKVAGYDTAVSAVNDATTGLAATNTLANQNKTNIATINTQIGTTDISSVGATLTAAIAKNAADIAGKQDAITDTNKLAANLVDFSSAQQNALDSGITAAKVAGYDTAVSAVNDATTGLAATNALANQNKADIATISGNITGLQNVVGDAQTTAATTGILNGIKIGADKTLVEAVDMIARNAAGTDADNTFTGTNTFEKQIVAEKGVKFGSNYSIDENGAATLASVTAANGFTVDANNTLTSTGLTAAAATIAGNATVGGTLGVTGALSGSTATFAGAVSADSLSATNGVSGKTLTATDSITVGTSTITSIDTAGVARNVAGSDSALAATSSVVATIKNQAEDATYTNTITSGSNVSGATLNAAIANLDATIGDMSGLNARDDANSVGNALANGGTTTPTTVVAALNNIDATLGTIHGLKTKLESAGTYKGNLATGTTVEEHLTAIDSAIGDRSSLASLNTAINNAAKTDVATALETTGNLIGNMTFDGTNYLASVTDLSEAVRVLDSNIAKVDHKVEKLEKKVNSGMASMAALTALVPNARDCGDTQISIGTGAYADRAGVAVGAFHYFNDHVLLNAGASYGGTSDWAFRAGITFGL